MVTSKRGGKYVAFAFTNGTWFQMEGRIEKQEGKETVRWSFLHCEPYLRRTFKGTTEELKQIVIDGVAKKKAPPAPNEKEPPGFGPPIKKNSGVNYPFAVIQLPFIGLIAALAAIFPTVFGGLALFMKRWVAALSTGGFVSIFVALPMITTITARCAVWSNEIWRWALAGTIGFGAGTAVLLANYWRNRELSAVVPLRVSAETVLLWVLAGSCVAYGSWEAGRNAGRGIVKGGGGLGPELSVEPIWHFAPDCGGEVVSSLATPERLYVAVMVTEGFSRTGRVYALDPATGAEQWCFPRDAGGDPDLEMKIAFSTPVFADGRLYFGEGMHEDKNSRLFCLDVEKGKLLWTYQTESHTESTPFVADGKVVIGAGYHGIHCLDAVKGPGPENKPLWRYPADKSAEDRALHVDSNPVIANGRVYAGSGYKPDYVKDQGKINTIFCLDLNTGKKIWDERVDDSVYGSPLVHDGKVFIGTGNSTYSETFPSKRPGVLCRDAVTGQPIWECVLPENVMGRPAADKYQLYVGCLDGKAYALDQRTGKINWRIDMGAPVLANPVVELEGDTGIAGVVYFAGKYGSVTAVAPYQGKPFWSAAMSFWTQQPTGDLSATPSLLRTEDDNEIRHRLFIGFGQGNANATVPRLYCIEDRLKK